MGDKGKSLLGLLNESFPGVNVSNALERALDRAIETQRSLEIENALAIARGKIAALDSFFKVGSIFDQLNADAFKLQDQLEKYGAMRSAIEGAIGNFRHLDTTSFGLSHAAAAKLPLLVGSPIDEQTRESIRRLSEPYAALTASQWAMLGPDLNSVGVLSRTRQWADALIGSEARDYATMLGAGDEYRKQFEALNFAAGSIAEATAGFSVGSVAAQAALSVRFPLLEATATKMSLFAGAIDVLGPGAGSSQAAYRALLGDYSSSAMLHHPYWRDQRERAQHYRDMQVDEGLIDADNAATVAVLIESGVVEGERTRAGTMTAVVDAGPVKLRIMASRPKMGAFGAIEKFENTLRAFVSSKLEEAVGPNWFKLRVPGDVMGRAKERRREAMRAGEARLSLIHYTDLGDLIGLILRKDNWGELFEAVFDRAECLKVDLERLNANRRPTMHSRPVDPVQLCEIVLTIRRLIGWMERDGAWDQGWEDDT